MNKIFKMLKIFVILILLSIFTLTFAHSANASIIELPNQYQAPKMITMSLYGDSSTMAFNYNTIWDTDTVLQLVLDGKEFTEGNIIEFSGTTEKSKVANDGFIHKVVATNLKSNQKYLYRLGDKELNNWSDIGSFTTANDSDSLKFIHISDPQGYELAHYQNYNELLTKAIGKSNPNFIALTGDIVNDSYKDSTPKLEQWNWALTMQKDILQHIPVMACAGNHDASINDFNSRFNFNVANDSDMTNGSYYSFDYNNVHFTVLNTNDTLNGGLSRDQINWLINDLKNNCSAKFKIVMMHKGIYDAGGHSSNIDGEDNDIEHIRLQLTPIFDEYDVDLVLQGHDHLYSRSYPLSSGSDKFPVAHKENSIVTKEYNGLTYNLLDNPNGTIYLNSGTASGSKYYSVVSYDSNLIPIEYADSSSERMYTEISIEGNNLYATVYKLKNGKLDVFDTFGISKGIEENTESNLTPNENVNNYLPLIITIVSIVLGVRLLFLV